MVSICDGCFSARLELASQMRTRAEAGLAEAAPLTSRVPSPALAQRGPTQTPATLDLFSAPECYARYSGACRSPVALESLLGIACPLPRVRPSLLIVRRGQLGAPAILAHAEHSSGPFPLSPFDCPMERGRLREQSLYFIYSCII